MTDPRWTLRNIARRPIELHAIADVIVLASDDTIEVDAIGDHHKALIARGLMSAHPTPTATPPSASASASASARTAGAAAPSRATRNREQQTKTSRPKGEGA